MSYSDLTFKYIPPGYAVSATSEEDWTDFDKEAYGLHDLKVQKSCQSPAWMSFRLMAPQHTRPIPYRSLIALYDSTYSGDPDRPIFLGHVTEIKPVESNVVEYVCYDPTMRARNEISILSGDSNDTGNIPRRVYNTKIDTDDDYAYALDLNASVGTIIADLLTATYAELLTNCSAAPLTGGTDAYNSSDLTPFDFVSQEKIVFESEKLGQGIDRILQTWYPAYRMIFEPGFTSTLNRWRFYNAKTSSQVTLTLNDFSPSEKHVLSLSLNVDTTQRFTAIRISGPQSWVTTTVYSSDDPTTTGTSETGLTEGWTGGEAINFGTGGPQYPGVGDAGKTWQITDSTKRRMSRILPANSLLEDSQYNLNGTSLLYRDVRQPTLQVTFDDGATWVTVPGIRLDIRNGYVCAPVAQHQYDPAGSPEYKLPDNARLIYAYLSDPIEVRYPDESSTDQYVGTAFDVLGMEVEEHIYDDMLAVGYENGTPVTTATRTAQYEKLAEALLESKKDIIYTGGCTIEGIDYDWILLQKRVNFAAVDGNGDSLTTGWEDINSILTEVEYDYENDLTTLTFSSDQAQFTSSSIDTLKRLLKIRALQVVQQYETIFQASGQTIGLFQNLRNYLVDTSSGIAEVVGEF